MAKEGGLVAESKRSPTGSRQTGAADVAAALDVVARFSDAHGLSPRETEICALMSRGLQGKEIADRLGCSPSTVSVLRARLLKKVNCSSPAELLALLLVEATKQTER
jgi:DNA-binding CsgD family transcriptional regulator